jgi:hypothetical protein
MVGYVFLRHLRPELDGEDVRRLPAKTRLRRVEYLDEQAMRLYIYSMTYVSHVFGWSGASEASEAINFYILVRYSTPLYATLHCSTLLYATLRYSTLLYSTLRYSMLLYATLLGVTRRYSTLC